MLLSYQAYLYHHPIYQLKWVSLPLEVALELLFVILLHLEQLVQLVPMNDDYVVYAYHLFSRHFLALENSTWLELEQ